MNPSPTDVSDQDFARASSFEGAWQTRVLWVVLLWGLALLVYRDTAGSIVSTWIEYDTYSHGFLVIPISLWLIWEQRGRLVAHPPGFSLLALSAAAMAGLAWFAGSLVYVQAVQQFALVALLIALIWFCAGTRATRTIVFPLAYLFFAVPVGEVFVPPMMELTATYTVDLVRLTGIPVYREGLYFSLPSGDWSVVKACSGVRYLIASLALGTIFAYLTYRSIYRRLLFVLAAILVPIVANVLRAYMIVMLGHLSDMTIATGVDHLIYGWVFFGVVMLLLFWVGSWFAETGSAAAAEASTAQLQQSTDMPGPTTAPASMLYLLGIAAVVVVFPLLSSALEGRSLNIPDDDLEIVAMPSRWEPIEGAPWSWRPPFYGADKQVHTYFRSNGRVYGISIGLYLLQKQGDEMISYRNGLVDKAQGDWKIVEQQVATIDGRSGDLAVDMARIAGEGYSLRLYSWYDIGGLETANKYAAKVKELLEKVTFSTAGSVRMLVYAEAGAGGLAEELDVFVGDSRPRIDAAIQQITDSVRR